MNFPFLRLPSLPAYRPGNPALERATEALIQAQESSAIERANQNNNPQASLQSVYGVPWLLGRPGGSPLGAYAMDNPIIYSTPNTPTNPPGKVLTSYDMRTIARNYDVMASCIAHLKREVAAVPLIWIPKDNRDVSARTKAQLKEANQFCSSWGGLGEQGQHRSDFESEMIDDLLTLGCHSTHYVQNRKGEITQCVNVQADTIRPVVDGYGWPPDADGANYDVYEQWILGVKVTGFTRQEQRYKGLYPATWTPFYVSPVELLITNATSYIYAQQWNLGWLSDGTTNDQWLKFPRVANIDDMTPEQIHQWVFFLSNLNSGDTRNRHKLKALPPGAELVEGLRTKDWDFEKFSTYLGTLCAGVYGVQRSAIGLVGEQYKESIESSKKSTTQFGAGIVFEYRVAFYDDLADRKGWDAIQSSNAFIDQDDALTKAQAAQILIQNGLRTVNELRQADGLEAYQFGGNAPLVLNSLQPLAIESGDKEAEPIDSTALPEVHKVPAETKALPAPKMNKQQKQNKKDVEQQTNDAGEEERAALAQWQRKALGRLRHGKTASCAFQSEYIAENRCAEIIDGLADAESDDDVRAVFADIYRRYSNCTTQIDFPQSISNRIQKWAKNNIPKESRSSEGEEWGGDSVVDGIETNTHVTVRYGLKGTPEKKLSNLLKGFGELRIELGNIGLFHAEDYDVVILEINSPQLHKLNKLIDTNVACVETYPVYKPHATLAYVVKGSADDLEGNDYFAGEKLHFTSIQLGNRDGEKIDISLVSEERSAMAKKPNADPEEIEQPDYANLTDAEIEANTEQFSLNDLVSALHSATPSMLPYLTAGKDES